VRLGVRVHRLLDRLCGKAEEINGGGDEALE
jgi:hypothetical protein